ncbi:MAG: GTPase Era [Ferrovibrionaceae bacterium]
MTEQRCGYIAILGAPNAGKSTLLNKLVGQKVSIVSPKVQTTRTRITAIAMEGDAQLVFVDTPGIFRTARRRLERAMLDAAWAGAKDGDVILLLVDAERGYDAETRAIVEALKAEGGKRPVALALNKIDLVKRESLLGLSAAINADFDFATTFMISAHKGSGCADVRKWLAQRLPVAPWLYPEDQLADISERLLAAEVTREKVFLRLHDELPYASTVETEAWQEKKDGSVRIEQTIYVQRESQKPIVLGKGGATIKKIGELARAELEQMFERRVHLFLFVKVREAWQDDPERYEAMGLEFPKG